MARHGGHRGGKAVTTGQPINVATMRAIDHDEDPDSEFWGMAWQVTLPMPADLSTNLQRIGWCRQRLGNTFQGLWNYRDPSREYLFRRKEDAVMFLLAWG